MKKVGYAGIVLVVALLFSLNSKAQGQKIEKGSKSTMKGQTVVFVCEHGSAKSVVAAAHFNRLAKERKLKLRAISRGTNPDEQLPINTINRLKTDGLKPDEDKPKKLAKADVDGAVRVVAICQIPETYASSTRVEQWDDVPPMSEDYNKFRDTIVERMKRLLDELVSAK